MKRAFRATGLTFAFLAALTVIGHPHHLDDDRAHHGGQACVVCKTPSITPNVAVSLQAPRIIAVESIVALPPSARNTLFPLSTRSRAPPVA